MPIDIISCPTLTVCPFYPLCFSFFHACFLDFLLSFVPSFLDLSMFPLAHAMGIMPTFDTSILLDNLAILLTYWTCCSHSHIESPFFSFVVFHSCSFFLCAVVDVTPKKESRGNLHAFYFSAKLKIGRAQRKNTTPDNEKKNPAIL